MCLPLNPTIGSITINLHLVFEILAYTLGYRYYLSLRQKTTDSISTDQRTWLIIAAAGGALIGSRAIGYFSEPLVDPSSLQMWIHWISNKSILGGLLGGTFAVELAKKYLKIQISSGDLFVYPIILGMILGRIGCFTQGVFDGTHGNPTDVPWAMDMGDGIPRHPAQLYEIIFLYACWGVLKMLESKLASGARFKIFMLSYLVFRFVTEWIKPVHFDCLGFSAVQVACLLGFVYYAPSFFRPKSLFAK